MNFIVHFICNINGVVSTMEGVDATAALAALHIFDLNGEAYLAAHTQNGSSLERDFDGYTIRVYRGCGGCRHIEACTSDPTTCGYWS